jgi:hypothetical protein
MLYFFCFSYLDGSVEDWGWKMTVTANYPIKLSTQNRWNWLLKLAFEIERCLVVVAADLVAGPAWNGELEGAYSCWMENSLVKPEYFQYETIIANEIDKFLMDFIDRPADSLGEKFIRQMRQEVAEDQGNMEAVNRAVYATCAAIVRANGLTAEALAYASGRREKPSPALLKAWKAGQKMRNYFTLSDLKSTVVTDTPITNKKTLLSRSASSSNRSKRSLYAGADEEVVETASRAVISRAKFLLRVPIKGLSSQDSDADPDADPDVAIPPSHIDRPSPYVLPSPPPTDLDKSKSDDSSSSSTESLGPPVPSPPKPGPTRWQLAARGINLKRQVSNETKNVTEMWYSLVEGAVTIDKLRNVFIHRRKFMERSRIGKELTTTEKVLSFVQSDVEIGKLHEMNNLRNKRAISRAKGFDIFYRLLHSASSKFLSPVSSSPPPSIRPSSCLVCPFEYSIAAVSFASALDRVCLDDSSYIYSAGLEGSSPEQINMLSEKVSLFEKSCVQVIQAGIKYCYEDAQQTYPVMSPLFSLWQSAILHGIRAFAMDFEFSDHLLVMESGIVECLNQLFKCGISNIVREAASSLLQILVGRFVVFDSVSESSLEPTELSKGLIVMLSDLLTFYTKGLSNENIKTSLPVDAELTGYSLGASSFLELTSNGSSYALSHTNIPLHHTFSLGIKRKNSLVLDCFQGMKNSDLIGKYVMRGSDWNDDEKKKADGGLGNIGVITQINEETETVRVKWVFDFAGKEYEYAFNFTHFTSSPLFHDEKKCKEEVVLADPDIAGFVFSKGSNEIGCNYEVRSFLPWITHLSMQILPDATVLVFYKVFDRDLVQLKSKSTVKSDIFTHVAITFDVLSASRLFINGLLEATAAAVVPVSSDELEEFESEHPISSASFNDKKIFQSKFSDHLILSFDERSTFGAHKGCYLLLESDSSPEGNNEAYSSTISSFTAENPASVIPSNKFSYLLGADAEIDSVVSNAWGFKGYLSRYGSSKRSEALSASCKLPLYFGHPSNVMNFDSNSLLKGVNAKLSSFTLYSKALSDREIKSLALSYQQLTQVEAEKSSFKEEIVLNMFGILKKAVDNLESLNDNAMRRCFADSGLISLIFSFFLKGTAVVRCAAYRLASFIFPFMDFELINGIALRNGLISNNSNDSGFGFLGFLFDQTGWFYNIFSKRFTLSSVSSVYKVSTPAESAEDQQAVIESQINLFQSFAKENSLWSAPLQELLTFQLTKATGIIGLLRTAAEDEMSSYSPSTFKGISKYSSLLSEANGVLSLLSLLRGVSLGLSLGTNCLYCDPASGIMESATILGISSIPILDSAATDEDRKKWANMNSYGDAVTVLINCSSASSASLSGDRLPESILSVPRYSLRPSAGDATNRSGFNSFLAAHFTDASFPINTFLYSLFTVDVNYFRDKPALLVSDVVEEAIYESVHPYNNNSDDFKEISFDGAYKLEIFFDEQSRTASSDFVQFYKDSKRSESVGERYCGRVSDWFGFSLLSYA